MKVSQLATHLIGSEIIKIGNEVNDLKAKGASIANLTIGDLDSNLYPIPDELKSAIRTAYQNNLTNYPPANGLLNLRKAISEDIKKRWNLDYIENDILISGGSRPLIYATYKTIIDPGDKVVYPIPSWNNNHYSYLTSAKKIEVQTQSEYNFLPTANDLRPHLSGAVLLALCSPLNPTGTMFSKEQLKEICEMVLEENSKRLPHQKPLYVMYDQIYSLLTFGQEHYNPVSIFPEMANYTIFIDGISKSFAATGVRVGWAFGPNEIMDKMKSLLGHIGAWAPKPEQEAVAQYLKNDHQVDDFVNKFKGKIKNSLEILHSEIQNLKTQGFLVDSLAPMGAMYLTIALNYIGKTTPDGNKIKDSTDLVFYLIQKAGMALVPFSAFGNSREMPWFRASVGGVSQDEIIRIISPLKSALQELK